MKNNKEKQLIEIWQEAVGEKIFGRDLLTEQKKFLPPMVGIVFTRDCSFRCKHCVMPEGTACDRGLVDLARIDRAIAAMQKVGIKDLVHTGRILKKEHLPILKKYQDRGLSISMINNGSGQALIKDIKDAGLYFDGGIDVSIDGNKEAHEAQRGAGTFDIALNGAKALAEVADHISITSTASTANYLTIADDMQKLAQELPFVKSFNLATTSPVAHHQERMTLSAEEMRFLFAELVKNSKKHPIRFVIYLNKDLKAIFPELKKYGRPKTKYISIEWKINNLTVAYFPPSISPVEEYALDANGLHVLPFGFDHSLADRPEKWQMNDDLVITNPRKSYEELSDKYYKIVGQKALQEEKEIFKGFF